MSKVTSKLQVTVPKAIADRYRIRPGDEILWEGAGDTIRVTPSSGRLRRTVASTDDLATRLHLFDQATARQRARETTAPKRRPPVKRGWRREDLYSDRGRPR